MLKKIRVFISLIIFVLISLFFIDFAGFMPHWVQVLADIQLVPALLSLNIVVLVSLLVLTLLFGRVYCSSICPLGIYQDIVSWLSRKVNKKKRFKFRKALTVLRWSVLGAVVLAFLFGFSFLVGLLDPYSIFGRITVHAFKPAYLAGNNLLESIFTHFGNHTFYKMSIYVASVSSMLIALISMLAIAYLAWVNGRVYCNSICPVGTALGAVSRYSMFKIQINNDLCNSCGSCGRQCKASCIDTKAHAIDYSRCINCFDCLEVCSKNAMKFTYKAQSKKVSTKTFDESKRRFMLAVGVSGLAASKLLSSPTLLTNSATKAKRTKAISPPGSISAQNLMNKCTSCHLCVSKCPSHVIKPSFTEYGLAGIMQPMLSFENGFCNYDCTICSDVCPSGALTKLSLDEKHLNQMGKVQFVHENCIVVTDETNCGACSEHCPTQAVSMVDYKDDLTIPFIKTEICVGCGGCEYVCPAKPNKAIYVEGIDKHNRIVLKKEKVVDVQVDDFGF